MQAALTIQLQGSFEIRFPLGEIHNTGLQLARAQPTKEWQPTPKGFLESISGDWGDLP
jgi:hypothetical protein